MRPWLRDVTLRDGLQSLDVVLPTAEKVAVYEEIVRSGIHAAQVTSFVSPRRIPQLADAEGLWNAIRHIPSAPDALIANYRGYERARDAGVGQVEMVLSLSAKYHQNNSGRSHEETATSIERIGQERSATGIELGIALANAWHCVYEGDTPQGVVLSWIERLRVWRPRYLLLADTTGFADADQVAALVRVVHREYPDLLLGVHLHVLQERHDSVAKAAAALDAGAHFLDASLLHIGGTPFAPGVGANLNSREVVAAGLFKLSVAQLSRAEERLLSAIHRASRTINDVPTGQP